MKVSVSQAINCAHQLPGTKVHGHTYRVTVTYSGSSNQKTGKVVDFCELHGALGNVLADLDHQRLENVIGEPATAERLAAFIKEHMEFTVSVRVQVGDDGWVETE